MLTLQVHLLSNVVNAYSSASRLYFITSPYIFGSLMERWHYLWEPTSGSYEFYNQICLIQKPWTAMVRAYLNKMMTIYLTAKDTTDLPVSKSSHSSSLIQSTGNLPLRKNLHHKAPLTRWWWMRDDASRKCTTMRSSIMDIKPKGDMFIYRLLL